MGRLTFSAPEIADLQAELFDTTVALYGPDGTTRGPADVRAHWQRIDFRELPPLERAELDRRKELRFDPAVTLSEFAQVADVQGRRWNVEAGTVDQFLVDDQPVYGRAICVRIP